MINSNMENMQDILKKYYAKGGKNLFENPVEDPHDYESFGPVYGGVYDQDLDRPVEIITNQWKNQVKDGTEISLVNKKVKTSNFNEPLTSLRFRDYVERERPFDDAEDFLLELICYKYVPDLNQIDGYIPGSIKAPVKSKQKFIGDNIPYMEPTIQVVVASSNVQLFDAMIVLKPLKQFMEQDHKQRGMPSQVHISRGAGQGRGVRSVIDAGKKLGMPVIK